MIKANTLIAFIFYSFLFVLADINYLAFSGTQKNALFTSVSYWLTESAGLYGSLVAIVLMCVLSINKQSPILLQVKHFVRSGFIIFFILINIVLFNEYVLKPSFKFIRPSHQYIYHQINKDNSLVNLYELSTNQRQNFVSKIIETNKLKFDNIDKRVLNHWIAVTGYSFPSGHAFNAFLIASLMVFCLRLNNYFARNKMLLWVPYLWAIAVSISRITLGVHNAVDVQVGAAIGLITGHVMLYFPNFIYWVFNKPCLLKNNNSMGNDFALQEISNEMQYI